MTPEETLRATTSAIEAVGETISVRRWSGLGSSRTKTEIATKGRMMAYSPDQIVGSVTQGDQKVILLTASIVSLLPLTTSDKIVVRGRELAIKAIDDNTRRVGGTLIALEIQAAG